MDKTIYKYLFMRPFLRQLERRSFFTRLTGITLRILAAMVILASLAMFFQAGKLIFNLPTNGILGGILFQLFYILAIYAVVHTMLIRAADIEALRDDRVFMLPLIAILVRMAGEIYAAYSALTAIGGGIFVWFTGRGISKMLNPMPLFFRTSQKPDFTGGIELMLNGVLLAIGAIILSYAVSEIIGALIRSDNARPVMNGPRQLGDQRAHSRFG
jgi:hypothetical protein